MRNRFFHGWNGFGCLNPCQSGKEVPGRRGGSFQASFSPRSKRPRNRAPRDLHRLPNDGHWDVHTCSVQNAWAKCPIFGQMRFEKERR